MLTPSNGFCFAPLTWVGERQPAASMTVGADVDHVVPLRAHLALGLDAVRPVHDERVARTAVVRGDLLGPLERRVAGVRPAGVEVVVGVLAAESLVEARELVLDLVRQTVEHDHLVEGAGQAALGAAAVVAPDVEEQRVVELAQLLERVDDAADLVVGVRGEAREDLHLRA